MKRIWKIVIAVLVFLVLALAVGSWYVSRHWKPILHERLQIMVSSASDSLYNLQYDEFDFSWYSGNAYFTNVSLSPNKEVYERLKTINRAPDNQYTVEIRAIKIRNFHPNLLYRNKKLHINEILIEDPTILVVNESLANDSVKIKEERSPYQKISKFLKELRIGNIDIKNLNYTIENHTLNEPKETKLKNVNILIRDFLIDSISQKDTSRIYYSSGLDFKMENYQISTRDSLYHVNLKEIDFSTSKQLLQINRVEMEPRYSKADFYEVADKPTDRLNVAFDSLRIQGIFISELLEKQLFHASNLHIDKGFVEVYNNSNYRRAKKNKRGKDPHQQLVKLATHFRIDTVNIRQTEIVYEERSKITQRVGKLSFNNSSIQFLNVTNDSVAISRNPIMRASLKSKFMNASPLNVNFQFNLASDIGAFNFQGKLNAMNGRVLNSVLKPLAQVELNSAEIKSLSFNFKADENASRGKVNFRYDDLILSLLKSDEEGSISKNKLASTLANSFIVNRSNPNELGEFIAGNVYYQRPETYSFFKFIWKSIFQGIKTSVGVDAEREANLKQTAAGAKNTIEDTKKAAKQVGSFIKGVFKKKEEE